MNATRRGWQVSLLLHALLIGGYLLFGVNLATSSRPVIIQLTFSTDKPVAPPPAPPAKSQPATNRRSAQPEPAPQPEPALQPPTVQSAPLPAPSQKAPSTPADLAKPVAEPVSEPVAEPIVAPAVDAGNGEAEAAGGPQAYVREHFTYIRNLVLRDLGYPPLARRMGWSGRLVIAFTIREDGTVTDLRVVEGSGRALLDENALATVRRVAPFPPPPAPAEILMPISYRLN